jgi:hypothetical protein
MRLKYRERLLYVGVGVLMLLVDWLSDFVAGYWIAISIPLLCIVFVALIAVNGSWLICPHCGMQAAGHPSGFRLPIGDCCPHCGKEI